jgi:hypothetical protein
MTCIEDVGRYPAEPCLSEDEALKKGTKVTPKQFFTRRAATRAKAWL